jgi:hypothetical protein
VPQCTAFAIAILGPNDNSKGSRQQQVIETRLMHLEPMYVLSFVSALLTTRFGVSCTNTNLNITDDEQKGGLETRLELLVSLHIYILFFAILKDSLFASYIYGTTANSHDL